MRYQSGVRIWASEQYMPYNLRFHTSKSQIKRRFFRVFKKFRQCLGRCIRSCTTFSFFCPNSYGVDRRGGQQCGNHSWQQLSPSVPTDGSLNHNCWVAVCGCDGNMNLNISTAVHIYPLFAQFRDTLAAGAANIPDIAVPHDQWGCGAPVIV